MSHHTITGTAPGQQTSMFEPAAKPNAEKVRDLRAEAERINRQAERDYDNGGTWERFGDLRIKARNLTREANALEDL